MFLRHIISVALLGLTLGACASPTPDSLAANDPFEAMNRDAFKRNQWMDRNFVFPTAWAYMQVVPDPARRSVRNIITNLDMPEIFVNDVLQGEAKRAKETVLRFTINSTLGLGGIFDVATGWGVPFHREDFGQTLATWGIGEGPYLVLPFLGPNNPRDAFGMATDLAINPVNFVHFKQHLWWEVGRNYFKLLDLRAQNIKTVQSIERGSVDFYASARSLYRQMRNADIRNGRNDVKNLPDF